MSVDIQIIQTIDNFYKNILDYKLSQVQRDLINLGIKLKKTI